MATMELEDSELVDPHPDIHELFRHYNSLYFDDALDACIVSWSSARMTSCAGTCHYLQGGCSQIRLSEPLLKFRPTSDLKNTLLHEMIHAFLWIMSSNEDHSDHGPTFRAIMNTINASSVTDPQRPSDGYNITIYHDFHKEVNNYRVHHWICESCGDLIKRAMNREPSTNDCIKHRGHDKSCGNLLCHWHGHKMRCSGKYKKIAEPSGYKVKGRASKDAHENDGNKCSVSASSHGMKQSGGRLQDFQKLKGALDNEKSKKITMFFQKSVGDAAVSSGIKSSSGETQAPSSDETKRSKGLELRIEGNTSRSEIPKTARKPECMKEHNDTCTEKKKSRKHEREITMTIPCLNYDADEESEEDIIPLVNKRSEGRKKEHLMKQVQEGRFDTEARDGIYRAEDGNTSADHPLICIDDDDDDDEKCMSRTTSEDRTEAYKNSSQLKSPVEVNVVYISD